MPTAEPWGVTPTGFVLPTQEDILERIERNQRATISEELDQSTEQLVGQMNGIYSRELAEVWEMGKDVYDSYDPDAAEGVSLTNVAKISGTGRRPASYSTVSMTVNVDNGVTLESGTHFIALQSNPSIRFTPQEDYTATSDGSHPNVIFRGENTGPLQVAGASEWNIVTPVTGWNSVGTNFGDSILGHAADDDADLRAERERQLALGGSATVDAIRAELEARDDIDRAIPFENNSGATDANGLPPHSFEMVILGASGNDDEIAQVIWDNRAAGIRPYGTETGEATDANGDPHPQSFSRASEKAVFVEYDLQVAANFNAADFKLQVATLADAAFDIGAAVLVTRMYAFAWQQPNILNVVAVRLGFSLNPTNSIDLAIGVREIARFDSGNIAIDEV